MNEKSNLNSRDNEPLIPRHGGYRRLKSFQLAQLIYDITVRFCDKYIEKRSRTHDQMVQAARSGVQNIAEGSIASATSKKMELKLTNVARASLEELTLDYEDYLRQRGFEILHADHPSLKRFKARRCSTMDEVRSWVEAEKRRGLTRTDTDEKTRTEGIENKSVSVGDSPPSRISAMLAANAAPIASIC